MHERKPYRYILSLKDTIFTETDINQNRVSFIHIINKMYLPLKSIQCMYCIDRD